MRVQKGGFMVYTLELYNFDLNVLFETVESIHIVRRVVNGTPREAP